ncbi:flagellar protein [Paenibacillus pasadenensis]|uniref:TIGR03826 family flagellar region protein n=1 Tax=Paenibacillus pasadenensis TaxID=217090 RepID=UPI00203B3964|nr:TIGR03826 family flagellar region protein [Paenibacillus pasadenensis]MCM3750188.1 flagellar protein [Paenibacillus pasadenensis]
MNLDNCPRCGRLFAKNFRDVCPNCIREIDREYDECRDYLRKYRGATINELSEQTNVSIRQITKFIKEGRISLLDAPNLSYPCEVCGILIREDHMCDSCRLRLRGDVQRMKDSETENKRNISVQRAYRIKDKS